MRFSVALPALVAALVLGGAARAELAPGDPAPVLKVSKWVKGQPIALTKGKVHVVEFWATWCGPCKVSIPHLTELAKKYKGKADFAGISVWESNPRARLTLPQINTKVAAFVKGMGAKMDYSVAVDDKPEKGTMASQWMEASGSDGIPTAFIVDAKGKIAWIGHPMEMEAPLAKIVAGKWDVAAEKKRASEAKAAEAKMESFAQQLQALLLGGKVEEAMAFVDKETAGSEPMKLQAAQMLNAIAWDIAEEKQPLPPQLAPLKEAILPMAQKAADLTKHEDGMILDTLAFIHYKKGNFKEALACQEKAVAKLPAGIDAAMRKEITDRLALYKSKVQ